MPGQSEPELVPGTWAENVFSIGMEVRLRGRCPDTVLEVVYEPLKSPGARFGMRFPIWPAEIKTVAIQAGQFTVYLGEASPGAHRKGSAPGFDGLLHVALVVRFGPASVCGRRK